MTTHHRSRSLTLLCAVVLGAFLTQCSINPATGKRELSLVSESQEIAMGRQADPQVVAQFGLYPDESLQAYVADLGARLAADSERPDLPWTFRVLDDPLVNAFALPGGYVYVTRGILAHLESEAELVGVLGHEIGHVTARHSDAAGKTAVVGRVAFVEHRGHVFRLLGYQRPEADRAAPLTRAIESFAPLRDQRLLDVEPMRLQIVRASRTGALDELPAIRRSALAPDRLALINRVEPGQRIPGNHLVKTVAGKDFTTAAEWRPSPLATPALPEARRA